MRHVATVSNHTCKNTKGRPLDWELTLPFRGGCWPLLSCEGVAPSFSGLGLVLIAKNAEIMEKRENKTIKQAEAKIEETMKKEKEKKTRSKKDRPTDSPKRNSFFFFFGSFFVVVGVGPFFSGLGLALPPSFSGFGLALPSFSLVGRGRGNGRKGRKKERE